jgi:hypothetical protein
LCLSGDPQVLQDGVSGSAREYPAVAEESAISRRRILLPRSAASAFGAHRPVDLPFDVCHSRYQKKFETELMYNLTQLSTSWTNLSLDTITRPIRH